MISLKQSSPDYATTVTLHLHNYENNQNSCHGNNSIKIGYHTHTYKLPTFLSLKRLQITKQSCQQ